MAHRELTVFYPHPWNALAVWKGAAAAIALACVTAAAVKMIRKAPFLAVGWFWFLGTLVPVIGIVQVGWQAMADRFAYIPLIGIFIAIAWGLPDLLKNRRWRYRALAIAAGIIIPVLMTVTWIQARTWKNSVSLYNHAIEATDKKYRSFAIVYFNLGIAHRDQKESKMAIANYKKALRLDPDYIKAHYNLGKALVKQKDFQEAAAHYRETIRLSPNHPAAHNNLGIALSLAENPEEAIIHFREAIRLIPEFVAAHYNLGNTLSLQGKFQEAIVNFEAAIKYDPALAMAHESLKEARSRAKTPKGTTNRQD